MGCDLCGSRENLFSAIVENSLMNICQKCLRFGKKVERNKNFNVNEVIKKPKIQEEINLLKDNYHLIIKVNREKLKLSQEDLAKQLNEKLSLIQKIENKELAPNDVLAKKLETFLHISLFEKYKENEVKLNVSNNALTIGDLLKLKKK